MISVNEVQQLLGGSGSVVSTDGGKIGNIGQVYLDDSTGEPAWVTVKTGMFGSSESFVPLEQASVSGDDIRVPYDKDRVKGAPRARPRTGTPTSPERRPRPPATAGHGPPAPAPR